MDIRTGRTYDTLADALKDGVPESDIAHVEHRDGEDGPIVTFPSGPFKDRVYRRTRTGLVRVKVAR